MEYRCPITESQSLSKLFSKRREIKENGEVKKGKRPFCFSVAFPPPWLPSSFSPMDKYPHSQETKHKLFISVHVICFVAGENKIRNRSPEIVSAASGSVCNSSPGEGGQKEKCRSPCEMVDTPTFLAVRSPHQIITFSSCQDTELPSLISAENPLLFVLTLLRLLCAFISK